MLLVAGVGAGGLVGELVEQEIGIRLEPERLGCGGRFRELEVGPRLVGTGSASLGLSGLAERATTLVASVA
jgi:hypothetical protein